MKNIRKFIKKHKFSIVLEILFIALTIAICALIYVQQLYQNKERLELQLENVHHNLETYEYNGPEDYLTLIYSEVSKMECYVNNKSYCGVAYNTFDLYNHLNFTSKDNDVIYTYLIDERNHISLRECFSDKDVDKFLNYVIDNEEHHAKGYFDWDAKVLKCYEDDKSRWIPVYIEWHDKDNNQKIVLSNEEKMKVHSDEIFEVGYATFNPQEYDVIYISFSYLNSAESANTQAWEYYADNELSASEIGFRMTINTIQSDAAFCVYVNVADYTLHTRKFMTSCIKVFIFIQFIAIVGILLYSYRARQEIKNREMKELFLNAMAHEMKTPIAVTVNCIDCIRNSVNTEKNDYYLDMINEESGHLNSLLESMLTYTRFTDSGYVLNRTCLSMAEEIRQTVKHFNTLIEQNDIIVEYIINSDFEVYGDKSLIRMVLDNYISNAVKHCECNKKIIITLDANQLSVYNDGGRIEDANLKRIWEPLFKEDESRREDEGSSGMGLAISAEILKLHNLEYGVKNKVEGVEFYVRLPSIKTKVKIWINR